LDVKSRDLLEETLDLYVKVHFVREIEEGDLVLEKIHMKKNPTYMLTKVVFQS